MQVSINSKAIISGKLNNVLNLLVSVHNSIFVEIVLLLLFVIVLLLYLLVLLFSQLLDLCRTKPVYQLSK